MLRLYISAPRVAKNSFVSGLLKQILPATGGKWPREGSPAGKTPWVTEVGWDGLKLECGHTHTVYFFQRNMQLLLWAEKEKPHRKKSQVVSCEKT